MFPIISHFCLRKPKGGGGPSVPIPPPPTPQHGQPCACRPLHRAVSRPSERGCEMGPGQETCAIPRPCSHLPVRTQLNKSHKRCIAHTSFSLEKLTWTSLFLTWEFGLLCLSVLNAKCPILQIWNGQGPYDTVYSVTRPTRSSMFPMTLGSQQSRAWAVSLLMPLSCIRKRVIPRGQGAQFHFPNEPPPKKAFPSQNEQPQRHGKTFPSFTGVFLISIWECARPEIYITNLSWKYILLQLTSSLNPC